MIFGLRLCACGHSDYDHFLGTGKCKPHDTPCDCMQFDGEGNSVTKPNDSSLVVALPDRIWVQPDFSFFQATGTGTYYRDPDGNSIAYVRVSTTSVPQADEVLELLKRVSKLSSIHGDCENANCRPCERDDDLANAANSLHARIASALRARGEQNKNQNSVEAGSKTT